MTEHFPFMYQRPSLIPQISIRRSCSVRELHEKLQQLINMGYGDHNVARMDYEVDIITLYAIKVVDTSEYATQGLCDDDETVIIM